MTGIKVAISLPRVTYQRAKRAVSRGRASSLSAYVANALDQKAMLDELDELLNDMLDQTGGPMTAAEEAHTDRIILGPKRRAKPR